MHMADALISPLVGGTFLVAAAGLTAHSAHKIQLDKDDQKIPLMGVMGAFVFAAQMINFTIPGTGSSGHLGGGLLLAILLGPYAGFLAIASVLTIQALFFADGGLLALGCNIINMGFFSSFIAYPLIYKPIVQKTVSARKILVGSMLAAIAALQLGAFSVVLQTLLSGKMALPFGTFAWLMQPIHLAIGVVEGLITAAVVGFVYRTRPEIIQAQAETPSRTSFSQKKLLLILLLLVILIGGILSWFASSNPDGLEWSMEKVAGTAEFEGNTRIHQFWADLQERLAILPDYALKSNEADSGIFSQDQAGTSLSGLVGGLLSLTLIAGIGALIKWFRKLKRIS